MFSVLWQGKCTYLSFHFLFLYYVIHCDNTEYIIFFKPFQSWPVNHLVVPIGVSHISLWLQEIQSREWEKRTKNKRTIWAWVNSSARRSSCDTLHFWCSCRLTLACIYSEISTKLSGMPIHPDRPSLTASEPYLMPTGLFCCLVSTPTALLPRPSPTASCGFLLPTGRLASLGPAFPTPLLVSSEISSPGLCLVSRQNKQLDRLLGAPPS